MPTVLTSAHDLNAEPGDWYKSHRDTFHNYRHPALAAKASSKGAVDPGVTALRAWKTRLSSLIERAVGNGVIEQPDENEVLGRGRKRPDNVESGEEAESRKRAALLSPQTNDFEVSSKGNVNWKYLPLSFPLPLDGRGWGWTSGA